MKNIKTNTIFVNNVSKANPLFYKIPTLCIYNKYNEDTRETQPKYFYDLASFNNNKRPMRNSTKRDMQYHILMDLHSNLKDYVYPILSMISQ